MQHRGKDEKGKFCWCRVYCEELEQLMLMKMLLVMLMLMLMPMLMMMLSVVNVVKNWGGWVGGCAIPPRHLVSARELVLEWGSVYPRNN